MIGVNGRQVSLYSQPRQFRKIYGEAPWTAERLAEVWDSALGQDELARFKQLGLALPGHEQQERVAGRRDERTRTAGAASWGTRGRPHPGRCRAVLHQAARRCGRRRDKGREAWRRSGAVKFGRRSRRGCWCERRRGALPSPEHEQAQRGARPEDPRGPGVAQGPRGELRYRGGKLPASHGQGVGARLCDARGRQTGFVMTSISAFGQDGPYRDFDAVILLPSRWTPADARDWRPKPGALDARRPPGGIPGWPERGGWHDGRICITTSTGRANMWMSPSWNASRPTSKFDALHVHLHGRGPAPLVQPQHYVAPIRD